MLIKRINRASAEQVFIVVKNDDATTLSTGCAAAWAYDHGTAATTFTSDGAGYGVMYPNETASLNLNPGLWAGIVAGRDIQAGDYGSVQAYGEFDGAIFAGHDDHGQIDDFLTQTTSQTGGNFTNLIAKPIGLMNMTESDTGATSGWFALLQYVSTVNLTTQAAVTLDLKPFFPGGYAVPIQFNATHTTPNETNTITGRVFIRCL